eukprot:1602924-Amphidinium_carterae.1
MESGKKGLKVEVECGTIWLDDCVCVRYLGTFGRWSICAMAPHLQRASTDGKYLLPACTPLTHVLHIADSTANLIPHACNTRSTALMSLARLTPTYHCKRMHEAQSSYIFITAVALLSTQASHLWPKCKVGCSASCC